MGNKAAKYIMKGLPIDITSELHKKTIAIDGYNAIYKFLAVLRSRNGNPLSTKAGKITSHIYGLCRMVTTLLQNNCKLVFVMDGKTPYLKKETILKRKEMKEEARNLLNFYSKNTDLAEEKIIKRLKTINTYMTADILQSAIEVLTLYGVAIVFAESEGEATCAQLLKNKEVDYIISDDWDTLLYDVPYVIRNVIISTNSITANFFDKNLNLKKHDITQEQFLAVAVLSGTDYWPGVKMVGPITALKIVKQLGTDIDTYPNEYKNVDLKEFKEKYKAIYDLVFKPVKYMKIQYPTPCIESLKQYLLYECEFSMSTVLTFTNL